MKAFLDKFQISHRSARAFAMEYLMIGVLFAIAYFFWSPWVAIVVGFLIATRQGALIVLYHDGTHFLLSKNRRVNDFIVNAFGGLPLILPMHIYRPFHLTHHRLTGQDLDPERLVIYKGQNWNYEPLPTVQALKQLFEDFFFINSLRLITTFARERQHPERGWDRTPRRPHIEFYVLVIVFLVIHGTFWYLNPALYGKFCLVWYLPLITWTHMISKLRNFSEHQNVSRGDPTLSWEPGWIGKLTIWPYGTNYHREHHENTTLRWYELPGKSDTNRMSERDFITWFWQKKTQPRLETTNA